VRYKGGAQAITDLIGGQVDVMFNGMVATYPHVKAGKIRLIAISSTKRNPQMPDTPHRGRKPAGLFDGHFSRRAGPGGHTQGSDRQTARRGTSIAALPNVRERLTTLGAEPSGMSPVDFGHWLKAEIPSMAKIVKDEKITAD
jgi:tripartite-type tricarboxylate transporter receptor subunit TctC